ncbi:hypothetical protein PG997_000383 [Apiospora hydei]|uniref:Uncharacterized protein n=1 Tax=Apiospora hydei TaxID=1337664 RepID=A0ABR1XAJ8_9PEZI
MGFLVLDQDYESQAQAKIQASRSPDGVLRGNLQCEITLPLLTNPPESRLTCHETAQETAHVSAHISSRIHALYSQLAAHAAAASPSTPAAPEGIALGIEIAPQSFDIYPECDHRRYHSRRLHLHDPETLPLLPFVHKLSVKSAKTYDGVCNLYDLRPLSLLVPLQCIAALPKLTTLLLPWMWERPMPYASPSTPVREHYARPWEGPLRDARHDFGHAVCEPEKFLRGRRIPASLKNALLHFWEPAQIAEEDQSVARPDLVHPAERDPVSVGLCRLAAQLERLDLRALLTEDLFPAAGAEDQQWSSMQRLRVEFHPLRPDGMWYFVGPRGEDPLHSGGSEEQREGGFRISETTDYPREHDIAADKEIDEEYDEFPNGDSELDHLPDMFRTEPHRKRIEPLLGRFAAAVADMPRLEDAEMFAHVWWTPSESREEEYGGDAPYGKNSVHRWGVRYLAGRGSGGDDGDGKTTTPVVQWQVGDWRPSPGVMALFEALGTQEWLDLQFTEGRPSPTTDDAMRARLF